MTSTRLKVKRAVQRAVRLFGLDVRRYVPHPPHDLFTLLELYGVDTVFDIGANTGMSGEYLRNIGFTKKIVSFEPVAQLYDELVRKAARNPMWFCQQVALGDLEGDREMHLTGGGGGGNSILVPTGQMAARAPELRVVGKERVKVTTLRSVIDTYYDVGDRTDAMGRAAGPRLRER
jgi:FkbM family methyltransferase